MNRRMEMWVLAGVSAGLMAWGAAGIAANATQKARGIVFHDANNNQKFDADEKPLPGVRVSNGQQIVFTDAKGQYELPIDDDTTLFVIKPRGWRTPLSEHNLPRFYYVHKPHGSPTLKHPGVAPTGPLPDSVDFPLYPQAEPEKFEAVLFGDPQPRDQKEIDYIAHDVIEELAGTKASFGVTLGDIVFDDLAMMEPLNKTIALLGIPWYNVAGNHDINYDAKTRKHANETFERIYGPSYYSFDYGPVHFLVLDDIAWEIDGKTGKGSYHGGLGEEQMAFIKTDLEQIPANQMVVLMMHIPLNDVQDRHGLYRLIEQRPFCISISGHTHHHEHLWITDKDGWKGPKPHHHIINVTVCGSWWSGCARRTGHSPYDHGRRCAERLLDHLLRRDGLRARLLRRRSPGEPPDGDRRTRRDRPGPGRRDAGVRQLLQRICKVDGGVPRRSRTVAGDGARSGNRPEAAADVRARRGDSESGQRAEGAGPLAADVQAEGVVASVEGAASGWRGCGDAPDRGPRDG